MSGTTEPIVLELIKGRLTSARREVEALIERTAMSPVIREKKDYFVAFFSDRRGLITGTNFPLGANALPAVLEHFPADSMRPGDLYGYNDPYSSRGGVSHLPDFVLVRPVFHDDELVAFVQVFGHMWDVGGIAPGSVSPAAVDVFHEGLRVPPVKFQSEGVFDQTLLSIMLANSRFPEILRGDLRSLVAACQLGAQRVAETFSHFGVETTRSVIEGIFAQGRAVVRQGLASLADGTHEFSELIDPPGEGADTHKVTLTLSKKGDRVTVDTTASSDQSDWPINFMMDRSVIGMMYGIYCMTLDPTVALNAGILDGIAEVIMREGSILRPTFPAPLGMRGITWGHTTNAMLGTIAVASGGNSPAASASYVVYYLRGLDADTNEYVFFMDGLGAGYGAKPDGDGLDVIYYLAQKNMPVEFVETRWPVRVLSYELHRDSGGPGRYRGGVGVIRRIRILKGGLRFSGRVANVQHPPWGVAGGCSGGPGSIIRNPGTANEAILPPVCENVVLDEGEVVEVRTSGGGGYGDPATRDPDRVLADVLGGFVSLEAARTRYGVAIDPDKWVVDPMETAVLRERMPAASGLFHQRGEYVDRLHK